MDVSKLEGMSLNYWVARALGYQVKMDEPQSWQRKCLVYSTKAAEEAKKHPKPAYLNGLELIINRDGWIEYAPAVTWEPPRTGLHSDFSYGVSILIRMQSSNDLVLSYKGKGPHVIYAGIEEGPTGYDGETALEALLKCFVASVFGPEVSDRYR